MATERARTTIEQKSWFSVSAIHFSSVSLECCGDDQGSRFTKTARSAKVKNRLSSIVVFVQG